jgi:hypothetical protein
MHRCYKYLKENYPDRIHVVKMEDVLLELWFTVWKMCRFLEIRFEIAMLDYMSRIRHIKYKAIYKGKIDKSRVGLWKDWENSYDGFFKTEVADMPRIFNNLAPIIKEFGYG